MVTVVEQLCIKGYTLKAQNGDCCELKQGKVYTTTVPKDDVDTVTVFTNFWIPAPKEHFVLSEH